MDNLQQYYLRRLQNAQKKALAGEIEECLGTCFDLRLKPDLALYTRAMVCLTICDFVHIRRMPEKIEMARDALRIGKELKEEPISQNRSFWIETYDELIENAEKAIEEAEEEKKGHEATTTCAAENTKDAYEEEEPIGEEIPPRENNTEIVGMPKIEGVFTNRPATTSATAAAAKFKGSRQE